LLNLIRTAKPNRYDYSKNAGICQGRLYFAANHHHHFFYDYGQADFSPDDGFGLYRDADDLVLQPVGAV
jgi:hypothetical protein